MERGWGEAWTLAGVLTPEGSRRVQGSRGLSVAVPAVNFRLAVLVPPRGLLRSEWLGCCAGRGPEAALVTVKEVVPQPWVVTEARVENVHLSQGRFSCEAWGMQSTCGGSSVQS